MLLRLSSNVLGSRIGDMRHFCNSIIHMRRLRNETESVMELSCGIIRASHTSKGCYEFEIMGQLKRP